MPNQTGSFTVDFSARIKGYQDDIEVIRKALADIGEKSDIGKGLSKALKQVESQVDSLAKHMERRISSESGITNLTDQLHEVERGLMKIGATLEQVKWDDLGTDKLQEQIDEVNKSIAEVQKNLENDLVSGIEKAVNSAAELQQVFKDAKLDPKKMELDDISKKVHEAMALAEAQAAAAEKAFNTAKDAANAAAKAVENFETNTARTRGHALLKNDIEQMFSKQELTSDFDSTALDNFIAKLRAKLSQTKDLAREARTAINNELKQLGEARTVEELSTSLQNVNELFKSNGLGAASRNGGYRDILYAIQDITASAPHAQAVIQKLKGSVEQFFETYNGLGLNAAQKSTIIDLLNPDATIQDINAVKSRILEALRQYINDVEKEYRAAQKTQDAALTAQNAAEQNKTLTRQKADNLTVAGKNLDAEIATLKKEKEQLQEDIKKLNERLSNLERQKTDRNAKKTPQSETGKEIKGKTAESYRTTTKEAQKYSAQLDKIREQEAALGNIKSFIARWFSVTAVINMVKNAFNSMKNTIKELDDVMTEIAIVTDKTQADLWAQMSSYTAMAKTYAASIAGVYTVSQLYYQQGLQQAEVMALTEQTLKMAKISGLDYATATDYMTNAVRSFKMEMTDAQRVVDVYSAVAAASATNTTELATAMSKTASSAESVGSSFENTTAMMAVMIEATREAPENIGSALKSIISRYGEMKADPSALMDSEGEAMSLNKVDTALQTVGISIHDAAGQFRNFDEVIMELAQSWNTIDKNTQRYGIPIFMYC